jgi:hypothetical protein
LHQIDTNIIQIDELLVGGINEDWAVDDHPDAIFANSN